MELQKRERLIRELARSQPGLTPYTNRRPVRVPGRLDGATLGDLLLGVYPFASREYWEALAREGALLINEAPASLSEVVRCGDPILRLVPNTTEPEIGWEIGVLHEDDDLLVVNKPAPLPIHPCGRFNKHSITGLAKIAWPDLNIRPAHRIDANTTGLAVFTKSREAAGKVQFQFEGQKVEKTYLTRVEGVPAPARFTVDTPISAQPDRQGLREASPSGQPSLTTFEMLVPCDDGSALVEARPHTGRTNQIRIHLQTAGHPIVGDGAYGSTPELVEGFTSSELSLCLHAWKVRFLHPRTDLPIEFQTPLPPWAPELKPPDSSTESGVSAGSAP